MGVGTLPRVRDWMIAGTILTLLLASAIFFWIGIPVLVLWGLSRASLSGAQHFVLGLLAVPAAMFVFAPALFLLNRLYLQATHGLPVEEPPPRVLRRRGLRGPLEWVLVISLIVSLAGLVIWFFFFATNPPAQVI